MIKSVKNPGRNDPCPCGSGKKFKRCCLETLLLSSTDSEITRQKSIEKKSKSDTDQLYPTQNQAEAQRAYQLGITSATQGDSEQAVIYFKRALALKPDYVEVHNDLGLTFAAQGKLNEAIKHYECALGFKSDARIYNNLGIALAAQGKLEQAIVYYERALILKPDYVETHNNLGNALAEQGKLDQAIDHYERALALKPDYAEGHNNLGNVLMRNGKFGQATLHYQRAITLQPRFALAHNNLGLAFTAQGKFDQAVTHYKRALDLKPDYAAAHSNLLLNLNYNSANDPETVYAAHLDFSKQWEAPLAVLPHTPTKIHAGQRRLKVGYVSSDFRQHSVAHFIEPVLAHHDHDRFEIFCYSNYPQIDETTKRLMSHSDHWRNIFHLSDELAARQIRADQIDILIDLNGHTAHNRLLLFARKPAPLQVTWLGYPNTTGLSAMNYRLTDGFADPLGMTEHLHTERLIRLPGHFSCYQAPRDAPEVAALPALEKGYVTFGSFNKLTKITPEVMSVWAEILRALPGSRLALKNFGSSLEVMQQTIQEIFVGSGIAPEQLTLLGHAASQKMHLAQYGNIDIALDSFPYNGTTTSCEALWMGVPVVTLAGRTHAGRVGVSQLSNLNLTEFICQTRDEYIATALQWATDLAGLSALRKQLRARMTASPLTDAQRFTKNLEQTFLAM